MQEFEPKLKDKVITKESLGKYVYIFVLAVLLIGGISYGYTFFIQNKKIISGSITTAALTINLSDRNISASSLSVPSNDQEGLQEFSKALTISNQTNVDGRVKLKLVRNSGLALTDMRYAILVNGAIQEVDNVPSDGEILSSAIMGSETMNVEVRLWPKTTYSGNATTFVGTINSEIKYLGSTATDSISSPAGKYVNFNCSGNTCEKWQIVKVESDRLVLTRQNDYTNATSRTNSNRYNPASFNPVLTFNDDSMITSLSTDGKNVYLAKTVKIDDGTGTQADPYTLTNTDSREEDKKVIAVITYKDDNNTTVGTQNVYYNETNYISKTITDSNFQGWTDNTNNYQLGDTITITSDTNLTAMMVQTLQNKIMSLCNDSNVAYVQKYNATQNGPAMDTPDGSGNEDVCYYTTTSTNRNSDAEQNGNVIFGDYCWQIVRTTADGGVKLIYNGPKTSNNKCPSDADTTNYSSNPRPSSIGVVGTNGMQKTTLSGSKIYGDSFEIFNDNGTNKFRLLDTDTYTWGDSTYKNLIGKYVCGTSSSPTGNATTCTVLYYVGHYQSNTQASTEKYTIGTNSHYSQIGTSSYNAYYDSPALVGYMYGDLYNVILKEMVSAERKNVLERTSMYGTNYYYGEKVNWTGTTYELLMNDDTPPTSTSAWNNIRSSVAGKYVCTNGNTSCNEVRYILANSTDYYAINVLLQNNETITNKQVTWTYGLGITKSGNTYTLTNTGTKTFTLVDWYTTYNTDTGFKNIYVCEDFESTTCTKAYYITGTSNYQAIYQILNYTYYFASNINYVSSTNTYSYDTNGTIQEIYDWRTQYNTINNNHYMCENYDLVNNTCGANNPMYYANYTTNDQMYYAKLTGVNNISAALVNMLSKDTIENNQVVTVNKYNSAIKGVIDSWYESNLLVLGSYLDNDTVFCNDRSITNYGSWATNGSTTSNVNLTFKNANTPLETNATLGCSNVTDRFSKSNAKAELTYPIGLLTAAESVMMTSGYAKTGQTWWHGSPKSFGNNYATSSILNSSGGYEGNDINYVSGLRPVIVLAPGVEIEGNGTYNNPYVVKTSGS